MTKPWSVVTGGTSGLGYHISGALLDLGPVLSVGTNSDPTAHTGRDFHRFKIDLRDDPYTFLRGDWWDTVSNVPYPKTVKNLILNAGIGRSGHLHETHPSTLQGIVNVNLTSSLALLHHTIPGMLAAGEGNIIFLSSTAGLKGLAFDATYSATKHAIVGLAKSLAKEYKDLNVACICPGFIAGELTDRTIQSIQDRHGYKTTAEAKEHLLTKCGQKAFIQPRTIAALISDLCTGVCSFPSYGEPIVLT